MIITSDFPAFTTELSGLVTRCRVILYTFYNNKYDDKYQNGELTRGDFVSTVSYVQMSSPYELVDERTNFHLPAVSRGQRIMQKKMHFPVLHG